MTPSSKALLDAFGADRPDPALADRLALFGQFVGSWDLVVVNHDRESPATTTLQGEWHFGWALAGRAVADVWICPRRTERGESPGEHGASLRFYDESIDAWRSTWIGPHRAIVRPFIARAVPGGIVLEGEFREGTLTRWSFSEITPDGAPTSFRWRNEESPDGGVTWYLDQTFEATRTA